MKKLLIVEDDATLMELLCYYIKDTFDVDCLEAKDIPSAINKIHLADIDVVLLDYLLKNDTAIPIVQYIKSSKQKPTIILFSAVSGLEQIAASLKINEFLKKPFLLEDLDGVLKEYFTPKRKKS